MTIVAFLGVLRHRHRRLRHHSHRDEQPGRGSGRRHPADRHTDPLVAGRHHGSLPPLARPGLHVPGHGRHDPAARGRRPADRRRHGAGAGRCAEHAPRRWASGRSPSSAWSGLFGSQEAWPQRIARTLGIVGWGSALAGYFYLPYVLIPKGAEPLDRPGGGAHLADTRLAGGRVTRWLLTPPAYRSRSRLSSSRSSCCARPRSRWPRRWLSAPTSPSSHPTGPSTPLR